MAIHIVGVSGSLRSASVNTAVLQAIAAVLPDDMTFEFFSEMAGLPLFNVDLEQELPAVVMRWQQHICDADVLIIASPEYAHGVSGPMKNALDWLVGSGVLVGKPVVLLNTSSRAVHAVAALRETLSTMLAALEGPVLISPVPAGVSCAPPPALSLTLMRTLFPLLRRMASPHLTSCVTPTATLRNFR